MVKQEIYKINDFFALAGRKGQFICGKFGRGCRAATQRDKQIDTNPRTWAQTNFTLGEMTPQTICYVLLGAWHTQKVRQQIVESRGGDEELLLFFFFFQTLKAKNLSPAVVQIDGSCLPKLMNWGGAFLWLILLVSACYWLAGPKLHCFNHFHLCPMFFWVQLWPLGEQQDHQQPQQDILTFTPWSTKDWNP